MEAHRPYALADLNDPLEYDGNRRRPFWETMAAKAVRGDKYARDALKMRADWLDKIGRRS